MIFFGCCIILSSDIMKKILIFLVSLLSMHISYAEDYLSELYKSQFIDFSFNKDLSSFSATSYDAWLKDWKNITWKYDGGISNAVYSPDWKKFAYEGGIRVHKDGSDYTYWEVVVNWKILKWRYEQTFNPSFSKAWDLYFFWKKNNRSELLKNWKVISSKNYDVSEFAISDDNKSLSYVWYKNDRAYLIKDGKIIAKDFEYIDSLKYSPRSSDIFYITHLKDKTSLYKNSSLIFSDYDITLNWNSFAPDWSSYSYLFSRDNKFELISILIKDWKVIKSWYSAMALLTYSPDSNNLAYAWYNWKWYIIKNGKVVSKWYSYRPREIIFSPDSKSFSFVVDSWWQKTSVAKDWVIINTSFKSSQNVIYSSDSKHYFYIWCNDNDACNIIKDWTIIKTTPDILTNIFVSETWNKILYAWIRDDKYYVATMDY